MSFFHMNPDVAAFYQELVRSVQLYAQERHRIVNVGEMHLNSDGEEMWDLLCPRRGECGSVMYAWYSSLVNDKDVTIGEGGTLRRVLFSELDEFFMSP